ncbi:MAG: hypothetical protein JSS81_01435 [Acidobacteria bacterium]|nr:hypothetical protein [Acidobacteriota bacterium]
MVKLFISALFGVVLTAFSVSAQTDLCFKNEGLKFVRTVSFTLQGNKLEGTFESSGYEPTTSAETFEFTGRKTGSRLTIKFAGKPPYELPPGTKTIVWTLGPTTLKIPTYGKNYTTNRYSAYTAVYNKCGEI